MPHATPRGGYALMMVIFFHRSAADRDHGGGPAHLAGRQTRKKKRK